MNSYSYWNSCLSRISWNHGWIHIYEFTYNPYWIQGWIQQSEFKTEFDFVKKISIDIDSPSHTQQLLHLVIINVMWEHLKRLLFHLVQLTMVIQTLLKVCTSKLESISAAVPGRLVGHQWQHSLKVGNKRLGYPQTLIQCRAWQRAGIAGKFVVVRRSSAVDLGSVVTWHYVHTLSATSPPHHEKHKKTPHSARTYAPNMRDRVVGVVEQGSQLAWGCTEPVLAEVWIIDPPMEKAACKFMYVIFSPTSRDVLSTFWTDSQVGIQVTW